jgi:hypothetical protein
MGPPGPQGPPGITGISYVSYYLECPEKSYCPSPTDPIYYSCPTGFKPIGAGFSTNNLNPALHVVRSSPYSTPEKPNKWVMIFYNGSSEGGDTSIFVHVVCAEVSESE